MCVDSGRPHTQQFIRVQLPNSQLLLEPAPIRQVRAESFSSRVGAFQLRSARNPAACLLPISLLGNVTRRWRRDTASASIRCYVGVDSTVEAPWLGS